MNHAIYFQDKGEGPDKSPQQPVPEIVPPHKPDDVPTRDIPKPEIKPEIPGPRQEPEIEPHNPDVVEVPGTSDGPEVNIPERLMPGGALH
jgi:hypothetical protein